MVMMSLIWQLLIVFGSVLFGALFIGFVVLFLGQIWVEFRKITCKDNKTDG